MRLKSVSDVVDYQQCSGCGACTWARPETYEMHDVVEHGLRPRTKAGVIETDQDAEALLVCPGLGLEHRRTEWPSGTLPELANGWGPVLEVWEGYSSDAQIRFGASSGGAATALALHQMEKRDAHGLLHIRARADVPYLNETVLSTDRASVVDAVGSRYSPASPCDGLGLVEAAPRPCVMIGKPCDIAAASMARRLSDGLDRKFALTIAIFCAGTPSTEGTLQLLERMGVSDPGDVSAFRYRGMGWPGDATARLRSDSDERRLTYAQSWGDILSNHQQWRCRVCADHTGELADISVGDPWYREFPDGEPGRSLIVVRSERGRRALEAAVADGYVDCERVDADLLPRSQPNLLKARGAVAARVAVLRACLLPAPRYPGFVLWRFWLSELHALEKLRTITSTLKRIVMRRLYRRA